MERVAAESQNEWEYNVALAADDADPADNPGGDPYVIQSDGAATGTLSFDNEGNLVSHTPPASLFFVKMESMPSLKIAARDASPPPSPLMPLPPPLPPKSFLDAVGPFGFAAPMCTDTPLIT